MKPNLNPFAPNTSADTLRAWLEERNRDQDSADEHMLIPLAALTRAGVGYDALRHPVATAFVLGMSWSKIRLHSRQHEIASFEVDDAAAWNTLAVRRYLAPRWLPILALGLALWGAEIDVGHVLVLALVAIGVSGWAPLRATLASAGAAVWLLVTAPDLLPLWLGITFLARVLRASLGLVLVGIFTEHASSPLAFLGPFAQLRAAISPGWSALTIALDKATSDDRGRTEIFVAEARRHTSTARFRPVLLQCSALAHLATPDYQQALTLSHEARQTATGCSRAVRGWLCAQHAEILNGAGDAVLAERAWREASDLLSRERSGAYWWEYVQFKLASSQLAELDQTERCLAGLRTLYVLRRCGIRRGSHAMIRRTENCLLPLMHQAGNGAGAALYLSQLRLRDPIFMRTSFGYRQAELAAEQVLFASLLLDSSDRPDLYRVVFNVDEPGLGLELAENVATNALASLNATPSPPVRAQALAVLAEIQYRREGPAGAALGNALACLNIVQQVRYQLPTAEWRRRWVEGFAATYQLALKLAHPTHPALVAELLEVLRAQSVPLPPDAAAALLRSAFDSLIEPLAPSGHGSSSGAAAETLSDPLRDSTPVVLGASWVGGDPAAITDLDAIMGGVYRCGWYWSFARISDEIVHAWRDPRGEWFCEATSYLQIETALRHLFLSLPIEIEGEEDLLKRLSISPLFASGPNEIVANGSALDALHLIFGDLANLIPLGLRTVFTETHQLRRLVVAPVGNLNLIPLAMLPIDEDRRLIDVATIAHAPNAALIGYRAAWSVASDANSSPSGGVLTVLAPDFDPSAAERSDTLRHALQAPRADSAVVTGPLGMHDIRSLFRDAVSRDQVLHVVGHIDVPDVRDPGGSGLRIAGNQLVSIRAFYALDAHGAPLLRMPRRVVMAGCQSIGLYGAPMTAPTVLGASEWLGFGAAAMYGGAEQVFCTLFPIMDDPVTSRIESALVDAMRFWHMPELALRAVQRAELGRWLRGEGSIPMTFLAFAYVGIGGDDEPMDLNDRYWDGSTVP